jgi:hypothetical protein
MKYMIYMEVKEPMRENIKKMYEIEEERRSRGVTWQQTGEWVEQYVPLEGDKAFTIIDTENLAGILQWANAYSEVVKNLKIIPVLTRSEREELMQ